MINEGPEEKQPLKKREIPKRDKVKEKHVDMETCDTFDGGPDVREDVVKIGRLNIIDHKITPRESGMPKIHEMVIYVCL